MDPAAERTRKVFEDHRLYRRKLADVAFRLELWTEDMVRGRGGPDVESIRELVDDIRRLLVATEIV